MNLNIRIGKKRKLNLISPFIIGSYDANISSKEFERIYKTTNDNVGAIITKSITFNPQIGYPEPKTARFLDTLLVASGMANPGVKSICAEIRKFKIRNKSKLKIIASIGFEPGKSFLEAKKEIVDISLRLVQIGIDGLEINLSCPHSNPQEKYKTETIAQNPKLTFHLLSFLRKELKKKGHDTFIIAKVSGWNCNLNGICLAVKKADIDAVTISNIFPGTAYYTGFDDNIFNSINKKYQFGEYLVGNKKGGFAGPYMFPAVLLMIENIYRYIDIPIIATGGCCTNINTVVQSFMAGAQAISGVTPFYYNINYPNSKKNINHINDLSRKLNIFLDNEKIPLKKLIGYVAKK